MHRNVVGSPAISDVQLLLAMKKSEVDPASALLRIGRPQGSRLDPVLRDKGSADQPTTQQRQEERGEDRAPSEHRRHPWVTRRRASLRVVGDHLALALDEVHLAQAPRELALLDLLREVGVAELLGELDATVAPRRLFTGPEEGRRPGPPRERVRDSVGLGYVKVNRPVVLMKVMLREAPVGWVPAVHARRPVAVRVRARVVDTVVVRRFS